MSTHLLCPSCSTSNSLESIYCKSCGASLRAIFETDDKTAFVGEPSGDILKSLERKAYFARTAKLKLEVLSSNKIHTADLSKNSLTLGRTPIEPPSLPHLDLTADGAAEKGVSRQHARITRMNAVLVLEDLAALNGTFVNGDRISAVKPCVLCTGDEISLGRLKLKVSFEVPTSD
jgi:hypothetical protein